jgi:hypothetical protein
LRFVNQFFITVKILPRSAVGQERLSLVRIASPSPDSLSQNKVVSAVLLAIVGDSSTDIRFFDPSHLRFIDS